MPVATPSNTPPLFTPKPTPMKPAMWKNPVSPFLFYRTTKTELPMRKNSETLLEYVLAAVMAPVNDTLTRASTLRNTVPDAPATAVIRALLSADHVIRETFNGNSAGRVDAMLARGLALTLAETADDLKAARDTSPILLSDLLL